MPSSAAGVSAAELSADSVVPSAVVGVALGAPNAPDPWPKAKPTEGGELPEPPPKEKAGVAVFFSGVEVDVKGEAEPKLKAGLPSAALGALKLKAAGLASVVEGFGAAKLKGEAPAVEAEDEEEPFVEPKLKAEVFVDDPKDGFEVGGEGASSLDDAAASVLWTLLPNLDGGGLSMLEPKRRGLGLDGAAPKLNVDVLRPGSSVLE